MNETSNLVGQPTEVSMTIQVTRAATGKVEEYKLRGVIPAAATPEQPATETSQENQPCQ